MHDSSLRNSFKLNHTRPGAFRQGHPTTGCFFGPNGLAACHPEVWAALDAAE
jgi:hypothetical protein